MALTADPSDVLLTFAEISVAFAGFSSIVAIFQKRFHDDGASFDLFRFWIMLEFSLASLLFALLPFPLHFAGLSEPALWTSASATMLAFIIGHIFGLVLLRRRAPVVGLFDHSSLHGHCEPRLRRHHHLPASQHRGRWTSPQLRPIPLGLLMLMFAAGANFARLVWVGNSPLAR